MSIKAIDISGKKFGYWTAVRLHSIKKYKHFWTCKCICGRIKKVGKINLTRRNRATRSCGCKKSILISKKIKKHGYFGTRVYAAFHAMHNRTKGVGERNKIYIGIKICKRWDFFENFLIDMGEPPTEKHTLDRIDNSKGYFLENCRWATTLEQAKNSKKVRFVTYNNETLHLAEWERKYKISQHMLSRRLRAGWSIKEAFEIPVGTKRNQFNLKD